MADKVILRICNESRSIKCGYCCNRRGAAALIDALSAYVVQNDLQEQIEVQPGSCLKNCSQGISIETPGTGEVFSKMKAELIPEFINYVLGHAQKAPCPVVLLPAREYEPVKK